MDVVTGKELHSEIKTWLVDNVNPDKIFTVSDFYRLAWEAIRDIWRRNNLPILVGGTGFYIKTVLDGIATMGVAPDWELRKKLDMLEVKQLQGVLKKIDSKRWEGMNPSDQKNSRRLVRAIEVAGKKEGRRQNVATDFLWVGLTSGFKLLYERIDRRVDARLKMGAVEEARELGKRYGWDIPSMTGQGYRQLRYLIEGSVSLEEAVKRWKFAEHLYARKQMTWFKKEKRITWFDILGKNVWQKVEQKVLEWYT
jgi:tRNA dimethylallyltransferase